MQKVRDFPQWRVAGRVFKNAKHARAFAKRYAMELAATGNAAKVAIMQQDDPLLPPFVLDYVDSNES